MDERSRVVPVVAPLLRVLPVPIVDEEPVEPEPVDEAPVPVEPEPMLEEEPVPAPVADEPLPMVPDEVEPPVELPGPIEPPVLEPVLPAEEPLPAPPAPPAPPAWAMAKPLTASEVPKAAAMSVWRSFMTLSYAMKGERSTPSADAAGVSTRTRATRVPNTLRTANAAGRDRFGIPVGFAAQAAP
jgi:hypothetical protein